MEHMRMEEDDYGEGYIAESHPLKPTHLGVPSRESRAPSISSSMTDMDVPIYSRETTIPMYPSATGLQEEEGPLQEQSSMPADLHLNKTGLEKEEKQAFTPRLALAIVAAAFGSAFQHGYNTGVINNSAIVIKEWITENMQKRSNATIDPEDLKDQVTMAWSMNVSIFAVGGMLGSFMIGWFSNFFGRKGTLLVNNAFVLAASASQGLAKSLGVFELLHVGRFLIGVNSGLAAGVTPMYLSEISPVHLRGAVGSVYQLVITISILLSQVLSTQDVLGGVSTWPWLLALGIIPAIFQLVLLPCCPESPKYLLINKNKDVDAQNALAWLRGTSDVHSEINAMRSESEQMKLIPKCTLKEIVVNKSLRTPLIISSMAHISQQLCGINAVMFYSTQIFLMSNLNVAQAQIATIAVGVINVLMTMVSMVLVEKAGRKTLLVVGDFGMLVSTLSLAILMNYKENLVVSYICVLMVLLFVIMFATGPGSIPWFLVAELFNQSARPMATSIAIACNWIANIFVAMSFPILAEKLDTQVFFIFVVLQVFITLFAYFKVPETKNKSIEEITAMFRQQAYE